MIRHFLICAQSICIICHPQCFVSAILSMWLCFIQVVYCLGGLFRSKLYKVMKISFILEIKLCMRKILRCKEWPIQNCLHFGYVFMKKRIARKVSSGKNFHFSIVCLTPFAQMCAMECNQCARKSEGNIAVGWRQDRKYRFLTDSKLSFVYFF